jgi:hypothetical protein
LATLPVVIQGTGTIGKNVVLTQTQLLVDLDTASMKVSGDLTIEASAELRFLNVAPNGNHLQVTGNTKILSPIVYVEVKSGHSPSLTEEIKLMSYAALVESAGTFALELVGVTDFTAKTIVTDPVQLKVGFQPAAPSPTSSPAPGTPSPSPAPETGGMSGGVVAVIIVVVVLLVVGVVGLIFFFYKKKLACFTATIAPGPESPNRSESQPLRALQGNEPAQSASQSDQEAMHDPSPPEDPAVP